MSRSAAGQKPYYPFTEAALAASFLPPRDLRDAGWADVFDRLDAGESLRLVVLGGSMTFGVNCNGQAYTKCAWPAELAAWLRLVRPRWQLEVVNAAAGGVYADTLAAWPELEAADVYIIDTLVNAIQINQAAIPLFYDRLLWRLMQNVAGPTTGGPPAILSLQSLAPPMRDTANAESVVASYYGLATASYRNAIFGKAEMHATNISADILNLLWSPYYETHPGKCTHELLSDVVKYAFLRLLSNRSTTAAGSAAAAPTAAANFPWRARAGGLPPFSSFDNVGAGCASLPGRPLTTLSPRAGFEPALPAPSGWRLYADVPRKPGWIAFSGNVSGGLTFDVAFGFAPRLEVSHLVSYENMGAYNLSLTIGPCAWSWLIDTNYDAAASGRYHSVTEIAALGSVRALLDGRRRQRRRRRLQALIGAKLGDFPAPPCVAAAPDSTACADPCSPEPDVRYRITITPQQSPSSGDGKVKILGITSC